MRIISTFDQGWYKRVFKKDMLIVYSATDDTLRMIKIRNCVKTALFFRRYVQTTLLRQGPCRYSLLCIVVYAYISVLFVCKWYHTVYTELKIRFAIMFPTLH